MLTTIKLEFIGENWHAYRKRARIPDPSTERYAEYLGKDKSRPWVARIVGFHPIHRYQREFVDGYIDYSRTNSVGSRGVWLYYYVRDGVYEVNERTTWRIVRRYFIHAQQGSYHEISEEEVHLWLSDTSASPS